jgi:3-methyladenine DNA glycosylase/8-oxoguanine DNA glycosylase
MRRVTASDYERARRHLMRRDPALAAVIKQVGPCRLRDIPDLPPFMALAEVSCSA